MRQELKEHVGQLVTLIGAPTGKKKLGNFLYHRPLIIIPTFNLKANPLNGLEYKVSLKTIETVDHLWISPELTKYGLYKYKFFERPLSLENKMALVGRIEEYVRADHTIDYGLVIVNEVEKEVCSFISLEAVIHTTFLKSATTTDFYNKARQLLKVKGKPPIHNDIVQFMEAYTNHVLKRYDRITSLLKPAEATEHYSYEMQQYLTGMGKVLSAVIDKLDNLHKQITYFQKQCKNKIDRRISRKKAKAKIKQRAVGFRSYP